MAEEESAPLVAEETKDNIQENKVEEDKPKEDDENDKKEDDKKEDDKKEDNDEEKNQIELVPADYSPKPRGSIAEMATVPPYDGRRMSKLQMNEMKNQIENMTEALIQNPKEAARRYTQTIDEEKNNDKIQQDIENTTKSSTKSKSNFHTKKELDKLTPTAICIGLSPILFILFLLIFGLIIYGIKSNKKSGSFIAGPNGDWPNWGGNIQNQQRSINSIINSSNINSLQPLFCEYKQNYSTSSDLGMAGASGYIATDVGSKNGFFVDQSGYVTSINLFDCSLNWRTDISLIIGVKTKLISRNGVSLYRDSSGNRGVLIGTPNAGENSTKCYVLSLHQKTGKKIFSLEIEANGAPYCQTAGFIIQDNYAFGGISTINSCNYPENGKNCHYRGQVIKIDLDKQQVVNTWYSLPENSDYIGAAPINYPAILDDYLIVGTGPLFEAPNSVDTCMEGSAAILLDTDPINPCNEDMSNYTAWKCYQKGIYVDSINLINKTTFQHIASKPLSGNDVFSDKCNLWTDSFDLAICGDNKNIYGPGAAVSAQAAYIKDNNMYSSVLTKSGMFYVFAIQSLNVVLAKKIGPAGQYGGGLYSLAIDTNNYIAILTITGLSKSKFVMEDGTTTICGTGFVEAIDLDSGDTIWQLVNPYGLIGNDCKTDSMYDNYIKWDEIRGGPPCSEVYNSVTDTITKVINPTDWIKYRRKPKDQYNRATFLAPVTISNDLVFIPSDTGDVFVSNIMNGDVLDLLSCQNVKNTTSSEYNRPGLSAGVTVVQDRVIMYCGSGQFTPFSSGRYVVQYQLT